MKFDPVRLEDFPEGPAQTVRQQLKADEWIAAIVRLDLDERLAFSDRLVVLTSRRLFIVGSGASQDSKDAGFVAREYPLDEIASLAIHDRGGLGTLEVLAADSRLAVAHFTLGHSGFARDFVVAFEELQRGTYERAQVVAGAEQPRTEIPEPEERPLIASVGSLFRLFRFARQRKGVIALGIILTLATTGFGLVAPGLLWPLTDNILTPYGAQVKGIKARFDEGTINEGQKQAELARVKTDWHDRFVHDVPWYIARLAAALAAAGNQGEARSLLEELQELSKRRYITPECYFVVYTALGERDSAFTWLQKMYDVRSQYPLRLKVQPDFDGLRTDPRFSEWLRRLKLAP